MWCRGTLSSPAHRKFASSAETEVRTGVIARSRGSTVRPGRASENRSGRLLIAYSRDEISIIPTKFLPGMDRPEAQTIMSSSLKLFQSPNPDMSMLPLLSSDPGSGLQAGDMENSCRQPIQEETEGPRDTG